MRPSLVGASDRYLIGASLAAVVVFVGAWLVALQEPVPAWELDLTSDINGLPGWLAGLTWGPMQLGALIGPVVIGAAIALWSRSFRLGVAVVCGGLLAWFSAKGIKEVVGRGRPLEYLPDIIVRDGEGTGLGFVSGHTAVAFAVATVVAPFLPRWAQVAAFALATVVGFARVVHGVHLPMDILGGAAVGIVCGVIVHVIWRLLS